MKAPVSYGVALICLGTLLGHGMGMKAGASVGFHLLLAVPCPAGSGEERRDVYIRVLPGGRFWINEEPYDDADLRLHVMETIKRRAEKVVWLLGDERESFGEIASAVSKLKQDTPGLRIAVLTRSQFGPVDPIEMEAESQAGVPRKSFVHLCLPDAAARLGGT